MLDIEVVHSSIKYDQEIKMPLYAKAGIFDYWIFNLLDKYLKCYSELYHNKQDDPGFVIKRIVLTNQIIYLILLS